MRNGKFRFAMIAAFAVLLLGEAASAFYSPALGRFLSRDPVDEPGAVLLRTVAQRPTQARSIPLKRSQFMPRDPIRKEKALPQAAKDPNRYTYAFNEPADNIDPFGLAVFKCCRQAQIPTAASCGGKHCYIALTNSNDLMEKEEEGRIECMGMGKREGGVLNNCAIEQDCDKQRNPDNLVPEPEVVCTPIGDPNDNSHDDCVRQQVANTEAKIQKEGCCWSPWHNCENLVNSWLRKCGLPYTCENPGFCSPYF